MTNCEASAELAVVIITKVEFHYPPFHIHHPFDALFNTISKLNTVPRHTNKNDNTAHIGSNNYELISTTMYIQDDLDLGAINKELLLYNLSLFNWSPLHTSSDTDDACAIFYRIFCSQFNLCARSRPPARMSANFPRWYSKNLIKKIKNKGNIWKRYKKGKRLDWLDRFVRLRKKIKLCVEADYARHLKNIEMNITNNPSDF